MRTMGILLLLVGVAVLGYGIWQYYDAEQEFDASEIRTTVEDGDTPMAVWIGGAMLVVGGIAVVATRNKR
jgi:uncharacterized membrane protein YidH (DUF202 family)